MKVFRDTNGWSFCYKLDILVVYGTLFILMVQVFILGTISGNFDINKSGLTTWNRCNGSGSGAEFDRIYSRSSSC